MDDFYEIDFLNVGDSKSGDAIAIHYSYNGKMHIHVTDGGFQDTGDTIIEHINKYYGNPSYIDAVVVTHPDGDHTVGLRKLFDKYKIGELWMLRPWLYADELIDRFIRFTSTDNLIKRLKDLYPNIAVLEDLANKHDVPIREPFQGEHIGDFIVLNPTRAFYLDLIVESEKTPEPTRIEQSSFRQILEKALALVRAAWGQETFPEEDTSAENNMSVIQYANLCGKKILLTGDAGRAALGKAAEYAPYIEGLSLPGIDCIQVPHHGSRHNVSSEILDQWLGPKLSSQQDEGNSKFTAIVSAAKRDENHPRKSVIRAFIHRGGKVITTGGNCICTSYNAHEREGWVPVHAVPYPDKEEEL